MKILVIRFSSIGDIVLTTPVLRCIKKQKPETQIHYITKDKYKTLLEHSPYIDNIYTFTISITEIVKDLEKEKYDLLIDLHNNIRSLTLKLALRRPSTSFHKLNLRKWLTVRLKKNFMPDVHITSRYLKTVSTLGISDDKLGLDFFVNSQTLIPDFCIDFMKHYPEFYVFAIGGTYYTKKCTPDKIIEIINKIQRPVILIGGEEDTEAASLISKASLAKLLNTSGLLDIHQSALVMKEAKCVLSHDTGMMHIAAALHKPLVSIWGNTIPEFGMYPLYPEHFSPSPAIIENKQLTCRPCSKLGFDACPKKHFKCMNEIDIELIIKYITISMGFA